MKDIDEMIQRVQAQASRYDDDYIIAHLQLAKRLWEISKEGDGTWYLDKIVQTFCEVLEMQQDIIEDLKIEMESSNRDTSDHVVTLADVQSNYLAFPQGSAMISQEETNALFEVPVGGVFETSLQVKDAFFNFLKGRKNSKGKGLSPTTMYDYSSRINMLSIYFEREWRSGKLDGRLQVCEEYFMPGETYLNIYKHLDFFEGFIECKSREIKDREKEGIPFSAEELAEYPLCSYKNLRNTNAALVKFREFKELVAKLATARDDM